MQPESGIFSTSEL